jgi:FkbM family methyltransferase
MEKELSILPLLVCRELDSVDVGASYGDYAMPLSGLCRHVHCFEPVPEVRDQTRKRVEAQANISIYPCALSDRTGLATLRIPIFTSEEGEKSNTYLSTIEPENKLHSNAERRESVLVSSLDSFNLTEVGFVKIDVEGHELAVLRGAKELLRGSSPNLLIETEERHRPGAVNSVRELLESFGYVGVFYSDAHRAFIPMSDFVPEVHQRSEDLGSWRYANNFIFSRSPELLVRVAGVRPESLS